MADQLADQPETSLLSTVDICLGIGLEHMADADQPIY
jgi:hypothetical protein